MEIKFYISQYIDGDLEIECKHIHYAFDERFNFEKFPRKKINKLYGRNTRTLRNRKYRTYIWSCIIKPPMGGFLMWKNIGIFKR